MGNLEAKHTPYYAITDENNSPNGDADVSKNSENKRSFWIAKRANFDTKNASLFEYNNNRTLSLDSKSKVANKHLIYALNQIKTLKKLRHPNIVKYFYSEEPPPSQQQSQSHHAQANLKCILITEFIRPVANLVGNLTNEQIMHGIYGITNAIQFIHERAQMSHNNLSESCIYVNCKQVWKLNDFELALSFNDLTRENLRSIYEFKQKNAITPEEEANFHNSSENKLDLNRIYHEAPHSIDAYGWALTILNLLPNNKVKSFKTFFGDDATNEKEFINSNEQLEFYLSSNPTERPTLKSALDIKLFDLYKYNSDTTSIESQLFRIDNLEDLETNFSKLLDYLSELKPSSVNEKLIDFLLAPFMFFSARIQKEVFPLLFIPKELYVGEENFQAKIDFKNFYFSIYQNFTGGKCMHNEMTMGVSIEPFMDLNKYKTFVIPRILNLITMHSTQIRLVLLEYFPFYISHINDNDSLLYEILPELLLGLKDKNDELVSMTFACLSIMTKILGSETVVGKSTKNDRQNIFSDNLPKSISIDFKELMKSEQSSTDSLAKQSQRKITLPKNKSADFKNMHSANDSRFNENYGFSLNEKAKFSSATSLDQDIINMNGSVKSNDLKMISDSMIALHGETEEIADSNSTSSSTNNFTRPHPNDDIKLNDLKNKLKQENNYLNDFSQKIKEDDWSNDFGWSNEPNEFLDVIPTNDYVASASLSSLAGSVDMLVPQDEKIKSNFSLKNLTPSRKSMNYNSNLSNKEIGSEFDIKSIVIKKTEEPNLIDEFFNDMQPVIAKKQTNGYERLATEKKVITPSINDASKKLLFEPVDSIKADVSWECEDIDLDQF